MELNEKSYQLTTEQLSLSSKSIKSTLDLLFNQGCTIPFIARYRKDSTNGLDETEIAGIKKHYEANTDLLKRQQFIIDSLTKQDKLTPKLKISILSTVEITTLEDLYAPFKTKRKTKAQKAKDNGLFPLAELIKTTAKNINQIKTEEEQTYINENVKEFNDAIQGAQDIITEEIVHNTIIKDLLRQDYWKQASLQSSKRNKAEEIKDFDKFKDYFEFQQKISTLRERKTSHRFSAIRRGITNKILKATIEYNQEDAIKTIQANYLPLRNLGCAQIIKESITKAYINYIHPTLDLEIKSELKKISDDFAIEVFSLNLKNLLLQPYLGQMPVMGIDPGIRTGCKIALIDKNGTFLNDSVIYPHQESKINHSKEIICKFIDQYNIKHIAIGNGTYGRETLEFINKSIPQVINKKTAATLVNEDGASIYSASDIAREEFPDKDITVRGAISIARRFQDPLAELVKIDPKSIGVGQYQHDVNQSKLKKSLNEVIDNCVNFVGVDLNTASSYLLSHVSGISSSIALNIVQKRNANGGFKNRKELESVSRFTAKVFEQSAGFLRIYNNDQILDSTFIHPEKYSIIESWCNKQKISIKELVKDNEIIKQLKDDQELSQELGSYTHLDIVKALAAPQQDPRTIFESFKYRDDISKISDLDEGQYYPGIVTNITQFGAFVDIGIKENGLIHKSKMATKFVEDPATILKLGQELEVTVLEVDIQRKRIQLSLVD